MSKYNVVILALLVSIAYIAMTLLQRDFTVAGIIFIFLFVFTIYQVETDKTKIETGIVYENIRCRLRNNGEWRIIIKNCQTQKKSLLSRNKPLPRGLFFKNNLGDLVALKVTGAIIK